MTNISRTMTNISRAMANINCALTNISRALASHGRELHIAVSSALCVKGSIQQTLSIQAIRDDRVPTLSIQTISTELEFCCPGKREVAIPEFGAKYTTGRFADNHIKKCWY